MYLSDTITIEMELLAAAVNEIYIVRARDRA